VEDETETPPHFGLGHYSINSSEFLVTCLMCAKFDYNQFTFVEIASDKPYFQAHE